MAHAILNLFFITFLLLWLPDCSIGYEVSYNCTYSCSTFGFGFSFFITSVEIFIFMGALEGGLGVESWGSLVTYMEKVMASEISLTVTFVSSIKAHPQ